MNCEWATLIGPKFRDGLEHLLKVGGARNSQTLPSRSPSLPFPLYYFALKLNVKRECLVWGRQTRRRVVAMQYSGLRLDFYLWDLMNGTKRKWETVFVAESERRKKPSVGDKNESSRVCLVVWERCRGSECVTGSDCLEEIGILTLQHPSVPRKSRIQCLVSHTFSGFCRWNVAIAHTHTSTYGHP